MWQLYFMRYNGLGLGEVGEIEAQMFNKPQMLIEVRMFKFSTSAPILPNPCCAFVVFILLVIYIQIVLVRL